MLSQNLLTPTLKLGFIERFILMSKVNFWIHVVWLTKLRKPYITKEFKWKLYEHIRNNAEEKGVHIDFINGSEDHIHCLINLKPTQSLSRVIQLLKGESSKWINDNKFIKEYFEWQHEYYASSISESEVQKVRNYIKNQELHHREISTGSEIRDVFK